MELLIEIHNDVKMLNAENRRLSNMYQFSHETSFQAKR